VKINEIWGGGSFGGAAKEIARYLGGEENYRAVQYNQYKKQAEKARTQANTQNTDLPSTASSDAPISPLEGQVILVKGPGGQEYFKSYKNKWYIKLGRLNEFDVTHPVTKPEEIQTLEKLVPTGKRYPVVQDPEIGNKFVLDRKAMLSAVRKQRGKR